MRRFAVVLSFSMFALCVGAQPALADSPHFTRVAVSIGDPNVIGDPNSIGDPNLRISFKEAGLGDTVTVVINWRADATAVYACLNGGGKHPQATNKETVSGPVSGSGSFTSSKNGTISATVILAAPGPGDFACPSGQRLVVASVSYANVTVTDTTNNVSETLPGPFSKTFFNI